MHLARDFFKTPLTTFWKLFQGDKPHVIIDMLRKDPEADAWAPPEGISYIIRMPNGTLREIFQPYDMGRPVDPEKMCFVKLEAAGGNFYKFPTSKRYTAEPIAQSVREAVRGCDTYSLGFCC